MSENKTCEVVIVGAAHMDLQVYPVDGSLLETASYPAEKMVWSVGGDALNQATIITRLGHKVRLVSCIGSDAIGAMVINHCDKNGIDTSYLKCDPAKTTGVNIGLIRSDGERTFINNKSGSIWTFGPEDVDDKAVREGSILSFASIFNNPLLDESLMIPLFEQARAQGMKICADIVAPKRGETLKDIQRALSYVDYFFPNFEEAKAITGRKKPEDIADVLLALGVKNVLLKIGRRGCLVQNERESYIVPGYPHAACVDTTGAGDNFASGFLCGLLEGRSLAECAELANCTASLAVEAVGATNGVCSRQQVEERYTDYLRCMKR